MRLKLIKGVVFIFNLKNILMNMVHVTCIDISQQQWWFINVFRFCYLMYQLFYSRNGEQLNVDLLFVTNWVTYFLSSLG